MNKVEAKSVFWQILAVALCSVVFFAAVLVGGYYCFFGAAFSDPCVNEIVTTSVSPNGALKAVTFRRNCGATTSYSTHVSIMPAAAKLPNEGGNVFIVKLEPSITVRWIDDRHLSITGETQTQFLHLTEFRDISITYQ